jgi:single-strand DNA-binding protein
MGGGFDVANFRETHVLGDHDSDYCYHITVHVVSIFSHYRIFCEDLTANQPTIRLKTEPTPMEEKMNDTITTSGMVCTVPRYLKLDNGVSLTSFRFSSQQTRFDAKCGKFVEGNTNWYTVVAYGDFADVLAKEAQKGDKVTVVGEIIIRDWSDVDCAGTTVELVAKSVEKVSPRVARATITIDYPLPNNPAVNEEMLEEEIIESYKETFVEDIGHRMGWAYLTSMTSVEIITLENK